jgi:hypothetical protein
MNIFFTRLVKKHSFYYLYFNILFDVSVTKKQLLVLKRFDFLDFSSMKLSSLIWCIVGCRIPSDEIFAEKYETKIMRKEIFMDPTLCFIFHFV